MPGRAEGSQIDVGTELGIAAHSPSVAGDRLHSHAVVVTKKHQLPAITRRQSVSAFRVAQYPPAGPGCDDPYSGGQARSPVRPPRRAASLVGSDHGIDSDGRAGSLLMQSSEEDRNANHSFASQM